jgi:hypothetical protein
MRKEAGALEQGNSKLDVFPCHGRACHWKSGKPDFQQPIDSATRAGPSCGAIHVFDVICGKQDVDARHKAGHDDSANSSLL